MRENRYNSVEICKYDRHNNLVREYDTISDACRDNGIGYENLLRCIYHGDSMFGFFYDFPPDSRFTVRMYSNGKGRASYRTVPDDHSFV